MTRTDPGSDVIDSRDIIQRLEDLQEERENLATIFKENSVELDRFRGRSSQDELSDYIQELMHERDIALDDVEDELISIVADNEASLLEWDEENGEELNLLTAVTEEGERSSDWNYGVTLVLDSYFEDYARELADDLGVRGDDQRWPYNHISWPDAAAELQQDYFSLTYGGYTYWVRS